ncbi:MAG: Pycsar system effector family protein [candidate division Zixibacteria bacterium]
MKEKIEIQKSNYEWLLNSINNADAKAGFLITVVLALIGFTLTQLNGILDYGFSANCIRICIITVTILVLAFLLISLSFAIAAIWPRLTKKSKSIFYFNSIRNLNKEEYTKWVLQQDENSILDDISGQVWYLSKIVENKYRNIRFGMLFFGLSILFLLLIYLVRL